MFEIDKDFLNGVAAIVGTVFGAGILALPYVFAKSGFLIGLINLILIGAISTLIILYMCEVCLRTKETLQIVGLAEKYLGKRMKSIMLLFTVIGIYGALIAYLIGVGSSVSALINGNKLIYSTIFFIITAPIIYIGLKLVEKVELYLSFIKILFVLLLCFLLLPGIKTQNLTRFDLSKFFLPYGVLMFACMGYSVVPNLERILEKRKEITAKVVIIGMLICLIIYAFFSFVFIGNFGSNVKEIATESVQNSLSIFSSIFAIFTLTTPYIILAWVLKDTFKFDYKLKRPVPWILACVIPFLLMMIASPTFIQALEISGAYAGSLTYIIFCFMVKKAREKGDEKPCFVVPFGDLPLILIALFGIFGMLYTTLNFLGLI
jgi:amino acid permease